MKRAESHLGTLRRDPDLGIVVITSPETSLPASTVLEKKVRIPADLLEKELAVNLKALAKVNFFDALVPKTPAKDSRTPSLDLV